VIEIAAIVGAMILSVVSGSESERNMKAFPPAEPGMVRYVLHLPKQEDETAFRVELMIGKTVELDEANRYFFAGKVEELTIEGWGFTRFVLRELGPMAGTLIAVDPNAPKAPRFISLGGEPMLVRYNSRLPLVVYVPEGVEVKHRLWSASPETKSLERG
jgi:ecotin